MVTETKPHTVCRTRQKNTATRLAAASAGLAHHRDDVTPNHTADDRSGPWLSPPCDRHATPRYLGFRARGAPESLPDPLCHDAAEWRRSMADQQLISTADHDTLPGNYVRPEAQRPRLAEVVADASIPVVDRAQLVSKVGAACRSHGFFQVLNHGVPVELILSMLAVAHEFFRLPLEEKAKLYSNDPAKKIRLSTSFNVLKETVHNWRDYLRLHCYPLDRYLPDWPSNPSSFRDIVSTYCKEVRQLGFRLYGAISESLGLEQDYIKNVLGEQEQHMAVNFYPKCPEPELTFGLPAHTDPNALTILLMDQQVAGLQVLKEGRWIAVNPQPNALVINIGDQLQALSNGRYKSVWHRAVVNSDRARMSVASFLCPCNDVLVGPAQKLITDGSPAVYRNYTYDEYYKKFWSRNLDQEHFLELFRT